MCNDNELTKGQVTGYQCFNLMETVIISK